MRKLKDNLDVDSEELLTIYIKEISKIPSLSREEEEKLGEEILKGNEDARKKLIRANLKFVIKIAKKYHIPGVSLMDLINEGNIGLIHAAYKFDPRRGYHFITYAVWWIRQAVIKSLTQQTTMIKIASGKISTLNRIEKIVQSYLDNYKRYPTIDELTEILDIEKDEVNNLLKTRYNFISLDAGVNIDTPPLKEIIRDEEELDPANESIESVFRELLNKALRELPEAYKIIINLRYGLNGNKILSLESIGKKLGISKERVRQLELKAIKKLKKSKLIQQLKIFIG